MPDPAELNARQDTSIAATPTFADVLHATEWPSKDYLLPDGRRVVEARSDGTLWGRGRVHLCLSDDTCTSGRPNEVVSP